MDTKKICLQMIKIKFTPIAMRDERLINNCFTDTNRNLRRPQRITPAQEKLDIPCFQLIGVKA